MKTEIVLAGLKIIFGGWLIIDNPHYRLFLLWHVWLFIIILRTINVYIFWKNKYISALWASKIDPQFFVNWILVCEH